MEEAYVVQKAMSAILSTNLDLSKVTFLLISSVFYKARVGYTYTGAWLDTQLLTYFSPM